VPAERLRTENGLRIAVQGSAILCPNCRGRMTQLTLEAHFGRQVVIDLCFPCQAFWFDGFESLQLSPGSVLQLFKSLGEQSATRAKQWSTAIACPRCGLRLVPTFDQQRATRFEYQRCPQHHGRLISFFNFLREKDFVRPLSAVQIAELRRNVQTVNCSNCGAPVDVAAGATCAHCGSPLSMIDVAQAGALLAKLQDARTPTRGIDPALPLALERARQDVNASFLAFEGESGWFEQAADVGLVGAGLAAIGRWLTKAT